MSQQEFEPQQNERPFYTYSDSVQENAQESEARPYYWSTKPNTGNIPKNEHPANFEDSISGIPPYSYMAQDRPVQETQTHTTHTTSQQQQRQHYNFSPDGDAMEHGYRPYASYNNQVPPWARPQRGNKSARIIFLIILGFVLIKPLLVLLGALLLLAGVALASLFVLGGLLLVSMLIVFGLLGRRPPLGMFRMFRSPHHGRRWH